MEPITFLKEKLNFLSVQFPTIRVRYAYNNSIATHIVELTPENEYYNNASLDDAWIPILIEFMERFRGENISFTSSDSNLAISEAEMEFNMQKEALLM